MDEQELENLIEALSRFGERLREARELYFSKDDAGRAGAQAATNAAAELVLALDGFNEELALPLAAVAAALDDLTSGSQHEMLKPVPIEGRRPDTKMRQAMRASSAATMDLLMQVGFKREEAAREVANHLSKRGIDTPGYFKDLTWKTVATWRDELKKPSADNFAADVFKEIITEDIEIPTKDKFVFKRILLAMLDRNFLSVKAVTDSG